MKRDAIIAAAVESAGSDDFGDDEWIEGLDRLLGALAAEARLSQSGVGVAGAQIEAALVTRLRVIAWHNRHPELADLGIEAPIVLVGQPRTGTTILFDLLAQDPGLRAPLTWEVADPVPPPETATFTSDPRIDVAAIQQEFTEALIPGFQSIHPMGPERAQECVVMMAGDLRSMQFSTVYRIPTYTGWLLDEADLSSAYRYHRRFLQLLGSKHHGDRWLLKTPAHQWHLAELFAAYPDATLIYTHRDPLKVIASTASLTAALQRMAADETSLTEQAAEWAGYLVEGNDRTVAARRDGTVPDGHAIDVAFADLMTDPLAAIHAIYHQLGRELTAATEDAMRTFLADNARDKHGVHRYSFSETGLDPDELRARTASYQDFFSVPSEPLG